MYYWCNNDFSIKCRGIPTKNAIKIRFSTFGVFIHFFITPICVCVNYFQDSTLVTEKYRYLVNERHSLL